MSVLLVMIGGALGAGGRYLAGRMIVALLGPGYPWGTLGVNLVGALAMGLLVGVLARAPGLGEGWRLALGTGVLGGFTTFSAFALETTTMLQRGDWGTAIGYAMASVVGSVLALLMGLGLARGLG